MRKFVKKLQVKLANDIKWNHFSLANIRHALSLSDNGNNSEGQPGP
jgi:hypothetical protein